MWLLRLRQGAEVYYLLFVFVLFYVLFVCEYVRVWYVSSVCPSYIMPGNLCFEFD